MIYPETMAFEWQKYEGFGLLVSFGHGMGVPLFFFSTQMGSV